MYPRQNSRQRSKNRITAKNKELTSELRLLNNNLAITQITNQEVLATKSSIDSLIWQFSVFKDQINQISSAVDNIQRIYIDIQSLEHSLEVIFNKFDNILNTIPADINELRNLEMELNKSIQDTKAITNNPKLNNLIEELEDMNNSIDLL